MEGRVAGARRKRSEERKVEISEASCVKEKLINKQSGEISPEEEQMSTT